MSLSAGIRRRNLRRFADIDQQLIDLTAEAVESARHIVALEDRLTRIASLARHALAAKPRDLEETWMRVEQIAGTEGS